MLVCQKKKSRDKVTSVPISPLIISLFHTKFILYIRFLHYYKFICSSMIFIIKWKCPTAFLIILHVFGMPLTSWPWYVTLYQIIFYLRTVLLIFIQDTVSLYLSTWCSGKVLIHVVEDLGIVIPKAKQPWQKDIKTKLQHMNQYLTKLANELYVYCFDNFFFFFR